MDVASPTIAAVGRHGDAGVQLLGTAFAIGEGRFATTAHVVGQSGDGLVLVIGPEDVGGFQDTTVVQIQTVPAGVELVDPFSDIAVLSAPATSGITPSPLGAADSAHVGELMVLIGYPHANAGRLVLTRQTADVGAKVLLAAGPGKTKHLVLNIQAQPGQSGSPVVSAASGQIVAIVVGSFAPGGGGQISLGGIDPSTLHQTTHAVSAHHLSEMI